MLIQRAIRRYFCNSSRKKNVYITTPIYYVNASPHIGHIHSNVLADAISRWYKMKEQEVVFSTGTDEHGLKVQEAALKNGNINYQEFCDNVSRKFLDVFVKANVGYSKFVRTSEKKHHHSVQNLWRTLQKKGYIYMGIHESWYCMSDESFLTDTQVREAQDDSGNSFMVSKESGNRVEKLCEHNYKFKLSSFQDRLIEWLETNPNVIVPRSRYNEIINIVEGGLKDLSISRLSEKITWAIKVPDDDSHSIYVWLDALTNYLTCSGYPDEFEETWPADYHIVGKDILKFHAIYWPAFLMAADLPLPRKIVAHAHWTVDKVKMSKSLCNVVDPNDAISMYGADAIRYFLLREGVLNDDGDFSFKRLEDRVNSELADTLGNLVSRCTARSLVIDGKIPGCGDLNDHDIDLISRCERLIDNVSHLFERPDFSLGLKEIIFFLHEVNRFFSANEPWKLAKKLKNKSKLSSDEYISIEKRLHTVLNLSIESARVCAILLQPAIPESADRILNYLDVPKDERFLRHAIIRTEGAQSSIKNSKPFVAISKIINTKVR